MQPEPRLKAANILVFGVLSLTPIGIATGIPTWVIGTKAAERINLGIYERGERAIVLAGRALGLTGFVMNVPFWLLILLRWQA